MVDESFLSRHNGNFAAAKAKAETLFDNMANRFSGKLLTLGKDVIFSRIHFTEDVAPDAWNISSTEAWATNIRDYWKGPGKRCIERDGIILLTGQTFGLNGFHSGQTICEPGILSSTGSSEVMVVYFQNNDQTTENTMAHEIGHAMNLGHLDQIITYPGNIPGPSTTCYTACSSPQKPLMCVHAGEIENFTSCDLICLNHFFSDTKCPCLQTIFPSFVSNFTCPDPPSSVLIQFESDNPYPSKNCATGMDESTILITFTNNNQQAVRNLRLFLPNANSDRLDLVPVNCTDSKGRQACFNHVEIIPGNREEYRILKSMPSTPPVFPDDEQVFDLQPGESIVVSAKVRYTFGGSFTNPTDYKFELFAYTGTTTNINNPFSIFPAFEINAVPTKNLSAVIATSGIPVTQAPLLITGKLIVDGGVANYDFSQNKKLLFNTNGSGLEIANTATTVHGVEMAGCTQMWEGITVAPGASLEMRNAQIRDAQYAINIRKGGKVDVRNSSFFNNNFAVHTAMDGIGLYDMTLWSNRYGTIGDGLKPAYNGQNPVPLEKGYAGVFIKDNTANVSIETNPTNEQPNVFLNLKHGIIARNTALTVRNAMFEDITKVAPGSGYSAYTNSLITGKAIYVFGGSADVKGGLISADLPVVFDNCYTGIEALAAGVSIRECSMSGVYNGIVAKAGLTKPYDIAWNDITASDRGISVFYQSGPAGQSNIAYNTVRMTGNAAGVGIGAGGQEMFPQYGGTLLENIVRIDEGATGIALGTAHNLTVTGNNVHLDGAAALYGLKIEGGDGNTLNCNTVTNPGNGDNDGLYAVHASRARISCNSADGTARGLHFEGMSGGKMKAEVAGNTMKNNAGSGLWLGTNAVIGWQINRGNKWENAEALAGVNAQNDSKFIVDAYENDEFLPSTWLPVTWFENISDPALSYLCLPGSSCPVPPEAPDEALDIKIAKGDLSGIEYQAANIWLA